MNFGIYYINGGNFSALAALTEGAAAAVYGVPSAAQVRPMHPNYGGIKQDEISISIQEYECGVLTRAKRCQRGRNLSSSLKNGTN